MGKSSRAFYKREARDYACTAAPVFLLVFSPKATSHRLQIKGQRRELLTKVENEKYGGDKRELAKQACCL